MLERGREALNCAHLSAECSDGRKDGLRDECVTSIIKAQRLKRSREIADIWIGVGEDVQTADGGREIVDGARELLRHDTELYQVRREEVDVTVEPGA